MFSRVLVANRGEIAVRIIRALHELGVEAVAVYSTADANSLHVRLADEAVCIGPPPANESYLSISNVIGAAAAKPCIQATASSPRTQPSSRLARRRDSSSSARAPI